MKKLYSFSLNEGLMNILKIIAEKEQRSLTAMLQKIVSDFIEVNKEKYNIKEIPILKRKLRTAINWKLKYKIWNDIKSGKKLKEAAELYRITESQAFNISKDTNPAMNYFEKYFGCPIKSGTIYENWKKQLHEELDIKK